MTPARPTPRVSIGLPVYNGERYLQRTLDDLLGQTFEDLELVVCDNASTDRTPEILAAAAARDARVRVVRNARNLGALANANRAFALSRAPLYALASYDDRHAPDFLRQLVDALDAAPEAGLAYGRKTLIDSDGAPLAFDADREVYVDAEGGVFAYDARLERELPGDPVGRYRAVLRSNDVNAPIYGLFRRSLLQRVGEHKLQGSDRLVVARAALAQPVAFVDAPLFGYRIHAASTYHLTRAAWLAREAGRADAGSPVDGLRTLHVYLQAVRQARLRMPERLRAGAETLRYAVRPNVLRRIFVPGPDHFFGWTGSQNDTSPSPLIRRVNGTQFEREWGWLAMHPAGEA